MPYRLKNTVFRPVDDHVTGEPMGVSPLGQALDKNRQLKRMSRGCL